MYTIPVSINVNGTEYAIRNNGDFRVVLDCFSALSDVELDTKERLLASLIIFYKDFDTISSLAEIDDIEALVSGMYDFFNCGSSDNNTKSNHK